MCFVSVNQYAHFVGQVCVRFEFEDSIFDMGADFGEINACALARGRMITIGANEVVCFVVQDFINLHFDVSDRITCHPFG